MHLRAAHRPFALLASALILGSGLVAASPPVEAHAVEASTTFGTPGDYTYTVPADVVTLRVELIGARGGDGSGAENRGEGGSGAAVFGDIAVTPGQTLVVQVGGDGGSGEEDGSIGGLNGGGGGSYGFGGGGGGGGGGASDIGTSGRLSSRLLVAAGGGGGGASPWEEDGPSGGDAGESGACIGSDFDVPGAEPGGSDRGGQGATCDTTIDGSGEDGTFGAGGRGFAGGGGGWYGGGGGGYISWGDFRYGGSGAGGSSYIAPSVTNGLITTSGYRPPSVLITPTFPNNPVTITNIASPASLPADGQSVTTVTTTVRDVGGQPVTGQDVEVISTDPAQKVSAVEDRGDGTYTAQITASTRTGNARIVSSVGDLATLTTVKQTPVVAGPPVITPVPTSTPVPTPTGEPTSTPSPTGTPTPTPTDSPTAAPTSTSTSTPAPSPTSTNPGTSSGNGPPTATSGGTLPATGVPTDTASLLGVTALLVLLGGMALAFARRQQRRTR